MNYNENGQKKHRKYQLIEHFETYSEVLDLAANTITICFRLDKHQVGDEFYLYEHAREIKNNGAEKIIFNYSILNDYEEGRAYTFDILEERNGLLLVSNMQHLVHAVPAYFKDDPNQTQIELEVEKLDLDTNRLHFKRNCESRIEITYDLDDFEENVDYEFKLEKFFLNKKGYLVLIVQYNNKNYYLNPPPHLSKVLFKSPVIANIGTNNDGTERHLRLARHYLSKTLYTVGHKYTFTIISQVEDADNGFVYWLVADEHGNKNRYFPDADLAFDAELAKLREGDTVQLSVLNITQNGHAKLIADIKNMREQNYLVEDVFEAIGYANAEEEYFFKYANVLGIDDEEEDTDNTFLEQYNQGSNLWLFSYLSFLDEEVNNQLEAGAFERVKTLIDIYINIEKWMLEGSDYLTNFSPFKIEGIIQKAEDKIEKLRATLVAIDIFLEGKDQAYINNMNTMLERTPYLNSEKKEVFKQFIGIFQYFRDETDFEELLDTIFLLLERKLILEDDVWFFINTIDSFIYRIKGRINELLLEKLPYTRTKELEQLITYSYLLIYLYIMDKKHFSAGVTSINLLHNLSLYYNKQEYLDLAIDLIIHNGYIKPSVVFHKNIFDLDYNKLKSICVYNNEKERTLQNAGNILSLNGNFSIIPKNLVHIGNRSYKLKTLAQLGGFDLFVKSHFDIDEIDKNDDKDVVIEKVIKTIKHQSKNSDYEYNYFSYRTLDISADEIYTGRVKNIHPKGKYCYLTFVVDIYQIDTLMHINDFHKNGLAGNLNDFIGVGDQIRFKVKEVEDDKVRITTAHFIDDYAERVLANDDVHYGVVMQDPKYSNCKALTTEGLAVTLVDSSYNVGDVVKMSIGDYKEKSHWYIAYQHELCYKKITIDSAATYREHLIATDMLVPADENDTLAKEMTAKIKNAGYIRCENNSSKLRTLSSILIHTLEHRLNFITDPKEMALNYFFIITLSGVMKHPKSFEFSNKLNNLARIVKLEYAKDIELIQTGIDEDYLDEDTCQELNEENSTIEMLRYMSTNLIDLPINVNPSSAQYKLKKLIESINLIKSYELGGKLVDALKNLVVHELYNSLKVSDNSIKKLQSILADEHEEVKVEKPKRVITNLGAESKYKEFKTSIFHSASDEPQKDVIMRTICGFLNAYEGVGNLYIGVDDSGEIMGLKGDLNYYESVNNLDRYQNYLQQMVVESFPKEINSLLEYNFNKSNNLNYLEIVIPAHDKPVTYRNEFFQRQGVQTRILKGQDIADFIIRKTSKQTPASSTVAFQPNAASTEARELRPEKAEVQTLELPIEKVKDYVTGVKPEVYSLVDDASIHETKSMAEGALTAYDTERDNLLGYLYILEDERNMRYLLSATKIKNYIMEIPITEIYQTGYLLFCYDNACINKVAVRNVITKSFNTIYMNAISSQGNLMQIIPTLANEEIAIETKINNQKNVKRCNIDNISEHKVIGLKGRPVVEEKFDEVVAYYHNGQLTDALNAHECNNK